MALLEGDPSAALARPGGDRVASAETHLIRICRVYTKDCLLGTCHDCEKSINRFLLTTLTAKLRRDDRALAAALKRGLATRWKGRLG